MGIFDGVQNGLMGSLANPQTAGLLGMAQGLLAAAGPSRLPVTMGQALGAGIGNAQQGVAQGLQMQRQMLGMQALQSMLGGVPPQGASPPVTQMPPISGPANVPGLSGISSGMGGYGPQAMTPAVQPSQSAGPMIFGKTPQQLFQQGMMMSVAGIPGGGDMMKIAVQYDPTLAMQMPTDQMKNAVFASNGDMGAARNSVNAILGKQGAITVRQNGGAILPDGSVFMVPKMPEGTIPAYGPDHQIVGTQQVPGAVQAIAQTSAAQAAGQQGGKLAFTPQPVYNNATGQSGVALGGNLFGNQLGNQLGLPAGGSSQSGQPGNVPGFVPTSAPIGTETATNGLAKEYASQGTELPGIKNSLDGLDKALDLVNAGMTTGPGSEQKFDLTGLLNTWGLPIGKDAATNYQLAYKYLANANNQAMGAMGMSGSDARMGQFLHGNPNPETMNATSLASAIQYVRGQQAAVIANYQAKTAFLQKNNYNFTKLPQFNSQWAKAYDPNVMVLQQMSPEQGIRWIKENAPKGVTPDQFRQRIMQHASQMSQLGAF